MAPACAIVIADAVADAMIAKRMKRWMEKLADVSIPDGRYYIWVGDEFEEHRETAITRELECQITHCIA